MTPKQTVTQKMLADFAAARAKYPDGSISQIWPDAFYHHDVTVTSPNASKTLVSPQYCFVDAACKLLIACLETRGLTCEMLPGGGPPNATGFVLGGGWNYSSKVNWMQLMLDPDHKMPFNPGFLFTTYFTHGYPAHYALNMAEWELSQDAFAGGHTAIVPDIGEILSQTQD